MGAVHQQRQDWPESQRRQKRRRQRKEEVEYEADEAGGLVVGVKNEN